MSWMSLLSGVGARPPCAAAGLPCSQAHSGPFTAPPRPQPASAWALLLAAGPVTDSLRQRHSSSQASISIT